MALHYYRYKQFENARIHWLESSGQPTSIDPTTCKPIFETIAHTARCWLERADDQNKGDGFDSSPMSDHEVINLIGRIQAGFHESLLQAQKVELEVDPTQYETTDRLRGLWTFEGRVLWSGAVAIPERRLQFKHRFGEPITLVGRIRRGWT
jgi:hypothetical protein